MPPTTPTVSMKALNCTSCQMFNQAQTTLNTQVKNDKLSDILEAMALFYQQQLWTSATLHLLPLHDNSTNIYTYLKKKKKKSTVSCWVFHKKKTAQDLKWLFAPNCSAMRIVITHAVTLRLSCICRRLQQLLYAAVKNVDLFHILSIDSSLFI